MLKWYGDQVKQNLLNAGRKGVDATMATCVRTAKRSAPVDTSAYQGSIQMRPAVVRGDIAIGEWGSYNLDYAIIIEIGSEPHIIRPRNKKALFWKGAAHPVKVVHHPGTQGTNNLRNAADRHYPELARNIKRFLS